ncbi:YiiX/YebB-like N1pC/P60 family cysteine hydrolase [Fructobacillus parabroussonetiae]|uniref:Hydrolase n=1 Tax=Fructobacillus parabroussonetiae TaxID=2713174 RepID=A0ABS5QYV4_9LACO|nr:YiiX/YebB-like N1pC/P60 family cysteine hydrolase [Fructobacillus parabroussonetiae]MBS9337561.1 hydrolase [Fructobacillus parabroussonetiae]
MTALQSADLAFVRPSKRALDEAINQSTVEAEEKGYVHVALVVHEQGQLTVIEATVDSGAVERPLTSFLQDHEGLVDFYRLKDGPRNPTAIVKRARQFIGQPYNHGFFENGPGLYCSQLVTRAFSDEQVFKEEPLQFGPNGTILPHWLDYYRKLQRAIPIKELGSSPNSLLRSHSLIALHV